MSETSSAGASCSCSSSSHSSGASGSTGTRCSANCRTTAVTTRWNASCIAPLASSVSNMLRSSSSTPDIAAAAMDSSELAMSLNPRSGRTSVTIAVAASASASTALASSPFAGAAGAAAAASFAASARSAAVTCLSTSTNPGRYEPRRKPGRHPPSDAAMPTPSRSRRARARALRGSWRLGSRDLRVPGSPRSRHPAHSWHCAHRGFSASKSGSSRAKYARDASNSGQASPKLNHAPSKRDAAAFPVPDRLKSARSRRSWSSSRDSSSAFCLRSAKRNFSSVASSTSSLSSLAVFRSLSSREAGGDADRARCVAGPASRETAAALPPVGSPDSPARCVSKSKRNFSYRIRMECPADVAVDKSRPSASQTRFQRLSMVTASYPPSACTSQNTTYRSSSALLNTGVFGRRPSRRVKNASTLAKNVSRDGIAAAGTGLEAPSSAGLRGAGAGDATVATATVCGCIPYWCQCFRGFAGFADLTGFAGRADRGAGSWRNIFRASICDGSSANDPSAIRRRFFCL